ncbi:MAG: YjcZ family sporulation protein [Bacillaceae bacterium]|nr:YjcZ family sporulation protein [Bacillaceae bacterium]
MSGIYSDNQQFILVLVLYILLVIVGGVLTN